MVHGAPSHDSLGSCIYFLDLPPIMTTLHLWFHTILFTPTGSQPVWLPALEDNSYKVNAILQINKHRAHAEVK